MVLTLGAFRHPRYRFDSRKTGGRKLPFDPPNHTPYLPEPYNSLFTVNIVNDRGGAS